MGLYTPNGAWNIVLDTVGKGLYSVDGGYRCTTAQSSDFGIYAPDGSYFVEVTDGTTGKGVYNSRGNLRIALFDENSRGIYAANGAINTNHFDPISLFADNEVGVWYDPSDSQTLFKDINGSSTVTADGDPVNLMLDKSRGLVLGTEQVTQPLNISQFTNGGSVTYTQDGSSILVTRTTGSVTSVLAVPTPNNGSRYRIRGVISKVSGTGINRIYMGRNSTIDGVSTIWCDNTFDVRVTPAFSGVSLLLWCDDNTTIRIESLSIKELPGNHLVQATAAARPTYKTDGTRFWVESDGVDDSMKTLFTITQPWERISGLRQIAWTSSNVIFGGGNTNTGVVFQSGTTPNLAMTSGVGMNIGAVAIDTDFVLTERHAGASGRAAINNNAYNTGDVGTNVPGGITLFARNDGVAFSKTRCYGVIERAGTMTNTQIANARSYIATKSGVTL